MKKRSVYCVVATALAVVLLTGSPLPAQTKQKQQPAAKELSLTDDEIKILFEKKKDPLFAGILSFYMPGLGQFYSDEKLKGAAFLIVEYSIIVASFFYFLEFNFKAGGDSGFNLAIDAKRTDLGVISTKRKNLFYLTLGTLTILHFYNIVDAVQSAHSFNATLQEKRQNLKNKYPEINLGYNPDGGVQFGLSARF